MLTKRVMKRTTFLSRTLWYFFFAYGQVTIQTLPFSPGRLKCVAFERICVVQHTAAVNCPDVSPTGQCNVIYGCVTLKKEGVRIYTNSRVKIFPFS